MSRRSRRRERATSRRRFPRWRIVKGRLVGPMVEARVVDLGPAGARIETDQALRVGAPYAFTLKLDGASRRLRGRVRWCRLVSTRRAAAGDWTAIYRAGVDWSPPDSQPGD